MISIWNIYKITKNLQWNLGSVLPRNTPRICSIWPTYFTENIQEYGGAEIIIYKLETMNQTWVIWWDWYFFLKFICLKTRLKPTFSIKTDKHGSETLDISLATNDRTLTGDVVQRRRYGFPNTKTREIYDIFRNLNKSNTVFHPTEKTNPIRLLKISD